MDLDTFMQQIVPLDLILFQGTALFSKIIENGSAVVKNDGRFSHCGIVVTKKMCGDLHANVDDNEPLIMEVTISEFEKTKALGDTYDFGVQVRELRPVLVETIEQGGGAAVCHPKTNPYIQALLKEDEQTVAQIRATIDADFKQYCCTKTLYDLNIFDLLATVVPSLRGVRNETDKLLAYIQKNHPWLFCSELSCIIYRDLGIFPKDLDVQDYVPADFVSQEPQDLFQLSAYFQPPVFLHQIKTGVLGGLVADIEHCILL